MIAVATGALETMSKVIVRDLNVEIGSSVQYGKHNVDHCGDVDFVGHQG